MALITEARRSIISGEHNQLSRLTDEEKVYLMIGAMGSGKTSAMIFYLYDIVHFSRLLPTTEQVHTIILKDPIDNRNFLDLSSDSNLEKLIMLTEDRFKGKEFKGTIKDMVSEVIEFYQWLNSLEEILNPQPRMYGRYTRHLAVEAPNKLEKFKEIFMEHRNSPKHYFVFAIPDAQFSNYAEIEEIIHIVTNSTNASIVIEMLDNNFRGEPFVLKDGKGSFENLRRYATRVEQLYAKCNICLSEKAEFTARWVSFDGQNPVYAPIYDKLIRVGDHRPKEIEPGDLLAHGHEGQKVAVYYGAACRHHHKPEGKAEWIKFNGIIQPKGVREPQIAVSHTNEQMHKRFPHLSQFALDQMLLRAQEENRAIVEGDTIYPLN